MAATSSVQRLIAEGISHHQAGRAVEAELAYAKARVLAPRSWEAHHYGGMAALLLEKPREAVALFTRASQINPRASVTSIALGLSLQALGESALAESVLRRGQERDPGNGEISSNLAIVLRSRGAIDEALACHAAAVKAAPRNAMVWCGYGATMLEQARVGEAFECFEQALALDSGLQEARTGRAACLFRLHRVEEAIEEYRRILRAKPAHLAARSHMLMALHGSPLLSPAELFREHQTYGRFAGAAVRSIGRRLLGADERLRVAVLSPDLREHSIPYFLLPLFRHAAAHKVELHCFHDQGSEDAVSAELRRFTAGWTNVAEQLDGTVEQRLLASAPDVLLDLTGHTGSNRLGMLARRVAPIQVTYLGYPDTTGVQAMDLRLTDPVADPAGSSDAFCTEKLLRFSTCAWCYEPLVGAPPPRESVATPERIVFGCFSNFTKVTDAILTQWGRLLSETPGSSLLLKSPWLDREEVAKTIRQRLQRAGVDVGRVELLGLCSAPGSHLELYRRVDVALDTSPYNGTTTTCEALWMGVPVVTLRGDRHAARVGESLLSAIGLAGWVASDWDAYRALARQLAVAGPESAPRGALLRERMRGSLLMDAPTQAARFWQALRRVGATAS